MQINRYEQSRRESRSGSVYMMRMNTFCIVVNVSCTTCKVIGCSSTSRQEFRPVMNYTPCCIMKCLFNRMKNDEGVYIKSWEHLSTFFSFSLKKKRNKKGKDEEKNIRNWILNETVPVGETWTERERKNGERLGRRYVCTLWHFFRGLFSLASNLKIINRYFLGKKWVNIVKAAYIIIIAYSCVYTQTYYDTNLHFNKNKICTERIWKDLERYGKKFWTFVWFITTSI